MQTRGSSAFAEDDELREGIHKQLPPRPDSQPPAVALSSPRRQRFRRLPTTGPRDPNHPDSGDHHPDVLAVHRYWEEKRRGRRMPSRADIDPLELRRYLPGVILIDVVDDARRYVYRLVGTREVAMRGKDPTGQSMIEGFFGPNLEEALSIPDRVVLARAPLFLFRDFVAPDGRLGYEDLVMLPLSEDGERVTMILGYTHHRLG